MNEPVSSFQRIYEEQARLADLMERRRRRKLYIHILLFALTVLSTFFIGLSDGPLGALMYSGGLLSILLFHEMGHYLTARRYGVHTTLPFFIPMPLPPFGTMGAIIKMKGAIPHRKALFDIGAAGPLAGFILILPISFLGLHLSRVEHVAGLAESSLSLGDSLLFRIMAALVKGPLPEGHDIFLHPLAYAGWVGLLVTALNLLPVGQLDGGHIIYALFPQRSRFLSMVFYGVFIYICLFHYVGWLLIIVLLAIFRKHPATLNDAAPLGLKRQILGGVLLLIFILSFTPVPFGFGEGLIPLLRGWLGL